VCDREPGVAIPVSVLFEYGISHTKRVNNLTWQAEFEVLDVITISLLNKKKCHY